MLRGKHFTSARRWQRGFLKHFNAGAPRRGAVKQKNSLQLGVFASLR
jgi:hypothetical protein